MSGNSKQSKLEFKSIPSFKRRRETSSSSVSDSLVKRECSWICHPKYRLSWILVFQYLPYRPLIQLRSVCKSFHSISTQESLAWTSVVFDESIQPRCTCCDYSSTTLMNIKDRHIYVLNHMIDEQLCRQYYIYYPHVKDLMNVFPRLRSIPLITLSIGKYCYACKESLRIDTYNEYICNSSVHSCITNELTTLIGNEYGTQYDSISYNRPLRPVLNLKFSSLKHFHLYNTAFVGEDFALDFAYMIRHAPLLQTLVLINVNINKDTEDSLVFLDAISQSKSLQKMVLHRSSYIFAMWMMNRLPFPMNLKTLSIVCRELVYKDSFTMDYSLFASLLRPASDVLERLQLDLFSDPEENHIPDIPFDPLKCLQALFTFSFKRLTHLSIMYPMVIPNVYSKDPPIISIPSKLPDHLPTLQYLRLSKTYICRQSMNDIVEFVLNKPQEGWDCTWTDFPIFYLYVFLQPIIGQLRSFVIDDPFVDGHLYPFFKILYSHGGTPRNIGTTKGSLSKYWTLVHTLLFNHIPSSNKLENSIYDNQIYYFLQEQKTLNGLTMYEKCGNLINLSIHAEWEYALLIQLMYTKSFESVQSVHFKIFEPRKTFQQCASILQKLPNVQRIQLDTRQQISADVYRLLDLIRKIKPFCRHLTELGYRLENMDADCDPFYMTSINVLYQLYKSSIILYSHFRTLGIQTIHLPLLISPFSDSVDMVGIDPREYVLLKWQYIRLMVRLRYGKDTKAIRTMYRIQRMITTRITAHSYLRKSHSIFEQCEWD